ncbi:MAG: DUF2889 domain-containing protein [Smithellaceae bacterium]|mgnify:CR=1 FL=1|jgi:hypothetical protein|nr:DUF2889 domain-containing protein [Smithellaceae bacterium]MDD3259889.1 DUF2889 domain-containing protein [Smithellaceae bacterium]MDD3849648.1 DUF2889 domain-containing protein [Smithellaceae bacterium]HOQ72683.1 DUF2889 domain-containing protein [Smithellaceae bacterium]HPL10347.1 DUF2889 domain-containing protein [Smithellaceae bacterium]
MQTSWKNGKEKIYTRAIDISTWEYDAERIVVEGFLRDDRYQDTHTVTGETFPRGTLHHMSIRLLVNCSTLVIEDLDMELLSVPREVCRETMGFLAPVKGMTIARGFTARIKKLVGGPKGCAHVVELLLAMAPAVLQGVAAARSRRPSGVDDGQSKIILQYLINTCHAWREDGPFVEAYAQKIKAMTKSAL